MLGKVCLNAVKREDFLSHLCISCSTTPGWPSPSSQWCWCSDRGTTRYSYRSHCVCERTQKKKIMYEHCCIHTQWLLKQQPSCCVNSHHEAVDVWFAADTVQRCVLPLQTAGLRPGHRVHVGHFAVLKSKIWITSVQLVELSSTPLTADCWAVFKGALCNFFTGL